ncbi:hypothetical protein ACJIZ3_001673 [Penstemon smallii]|uniref:Uncharacterized protein n=1 Tax=Penstemon smallii TaxID=265156 RepID=A0ABD3U764_9LAMI
MSASTKLFQLQAAPPKGVSSMKASCIKPHATCTSKDLHCIPIQQWIERVPNKKNSHHATPYSYRSVHNMTNRCPILSRTSPALCGTSKLLPSESWNISSCQTPPAGLTTAWNAIVAMRTATNIMASRFLASHFSGRPYVIWCHHGHPLR